MREEDVDLVGFRRLQERFHDFLAFGAGEVAGLGLDDLDAGVILDDLLETFLAVDGGGGTRGADELGHIGVLTDVFHDPAACAAAFFHEVGADQGDIEAGFGHVDGAVEEDDRDAGFLGFLQDVFKTGCDDGGEGDHVHALADEVADGLDLVFLLLLGVGERQLDVGALGGFALDGVGAGLAPVALGSDLGESDLDLGVVALGAGGDEKRRGCGGHDDGCKLVHAAYLSLGGC